MKRLKKNISIVCLFSLLFIFLCPTSVFASTKAYYDAQKDINTVLKYTTGYSDGRVEFDTEAAKANGETDEIIEIGEGVNELSAAYYNAAHGIATHEGLPLYGNYCGPGYGGEDNGTPIDALDAACKTHDLCYAENGYFNCTCDQDLIDEINSKIQYMSGAQLSMAKKVLVYFKAQMAANGC